MSFGIGIACLGAAACLLLPAYYVNPAVGQRLRADRLHHRRAGRHGQLSGALLGGFMIGVVESVGGLWLGESLGQIGIFADLHRHPAVPAAGPVRSAR